MIKYPHRGLVQNEKKQSNLFDHLYVTAFVSWSSLLYLLSLIKGTQTLNIEADPKIKVARLGFGCLFLAIFVLMFFGVNFVKKKKKYVTPKIQYNVMTFNQSFISFASFILCDWIQKILYENLEKHNIYENNLKDILSILIIIRLIFFHSLVPFMILNILDNVMPSINDINDCKVFYISGLDFTPRQQVFLSLKPFGQNARWGSKTKFIKVNDLLLNEDKRNHKIFSLEPVEI